MKNLTLKEEAIMQILWRLEKAFLKEIMAEMKAPKPPVTTVSSIVRKLETMNMIGHKAFGNSHQYFPKLKKEAYRKSAFKKFLNNYFEGSPEQVLSYFVKEEKIDPKELNDLLDKLKDM